VGEDFKGCTELASTDDSFCSCSSIGDSFCSCSSIGDSFCSCSSCFGDSFGDCSNKLTGSDVLTLFLDSHLFVFLLNLSPLLHGVRRFLVIGLGTLGLGSLGVGTLGLGSLGLGSLGLGSLGLGSLGVGTLGLGTLGVGTLGLGSLGLGSLGVGSLGVGSLGLGSLGLGSLGVGSLVIGFGTLGVGTLGLGVNFKSSKVISAGPFATYFSHLPVFLLNRSPLGQGVFLFLAFIYLIFRQRIYLSIDSHIYTHIILRHTYTNIQTNNHTKL
jgi:hypothetical protein